MKITAHLAFTAALTTGALLASALTAAAWGDAAMGSQIARYEGIAPDAPRSIEEVPLDPRTRATVAGIDVSGHQGEVNWQEHWNLGRRFVYVKATEGTGFKNPRFGQQYTGSRQIGMIRGAYHFALPNRSSGAAQANYFVDNGGDWAKDGMTLPGALDIEHNPYGDTCYGLSQDAMARWIKNFSDTYRARTSRYPTIYTSANWWAKCTGGREDFSATNPLWIARYAAAIGALPHRWGIHTIWQYSSKPIDQNAFNGAYSRLRALAAG
ncbi:lysozyme [Allokutzneria sp. A3M-2-11 16]|uniref:lysozyme n=1 Tax=Allokutzneria sp. A3M-2-11 16 TaxID=2962043 RepID=UPI0020B6F4FA|nr:lysozyme [Allokutzneria sp. A3M-2-11 16]MCP3804388.1 lysozyme [Allokutzneria sp. A3M-2-11 16]